ncbi:MAG: thioredoxin TrxC [Thiobacillaceae bacterium]|jgi:thioredoxin 2
MELVCPSCSAINRVPDSRLTDHPSCGKCHQPLLPGKAIDLSSSRFDTFISRSGLPVVVDFWATWCGPCKMMAPVFAQVAIELANRACFAKVETETEQGLAARYGIRSIPTLAIFRNGREIARQAGAMDGVNLKRWLAANGV